MKSIKIHWKMFFFAFIFFPIFSYNVFADQSLILDEINPDITRLSVFNSAKYNLLLVAITKKNKPPFNCQPNRYIFYDYRFEKYYEISASNLKINSNYTSIFTTKVVSLGRAASNNDREWKRKANSLIKNLNVSAETMESSEMLSYDKNMVCWQQPGLTDIHGNHLKSFPLLAANFCKNSWCGEFYWTGSDNIQFWAQIHPQKYQLIHLNTKSGAYEFKKQGPVSKRKTFPQLNAPRENLVTSKNSSGHTISLPSIKGKKVRLSWKKLKNNKIRVSLFRNNIDKISAKKTTLKISESLMQKKIPQALQLIKFALWLNPENTDIKTERLIAYSSLLLFDKFFKSLKEDFSEKERFSACQKLHTEKSLRNFWKQDQFKKRFNKICY